MNNNYVYLAQAYGEGAYSSCTFNCTEGQPTQPGNPANPGTPGNPNTGFWQQPSFLIPALLVIAVVLVGIEFFVRKVVRRRKNAKQNDLGK